MLGGTHWRGLPLAALIITLISPTPLAAQTTGTSPTPTSTPTPGVTATATATPSAQAASTETPTPQPATTETPSAQPAAITPTPFVSNVPCATDDPHGPGGVQRSERHGSDADNDRGDNHDEFSSGNGQNLMIIHNCTDNKLRVRANIQVNTIPGRTADPINEAYAESSCTNCQTLSIALQIDLYSGERARTVAPQNYAIALNTNCNGCFTVARALQYVQPVEDPQHVPDDVAETVDQLQDELIAVQQDPDISLPDAEARLNDVLQRFTALGGTLGDQRDEKHD